jgi:aspartate aminotransferase-like enzyme
MLHKNRLFTPGPTPLLPAAQTAMASFTAHHRTADFRALFQRVLADMKEFIGTKNDVLVLACSGTGVMEASVSNLTSPGDKVLVLTAGKFGERWTGLARAFGCNVDVRARGDDTLLVVDAITGLGTTHLNVDGWGVDVIIGGSQKALMIPPGLAYCAVSERAWKRMDTTTSPRYYFDLRKERKSAAKGESAYTPATSLFAALGAALEFVRSMGNGELSTGREELVNNAELCAEMTRAGAKALGLRLYASSPAAALTAICAPEGLDSSKIVKEFREVFDAVVANGQGEMKGKLFRVAHIGYYDYLDTIGILGALEHVLARVADRSVEYGAAVRAAQEVYARTQSGKRQLVGA